MRKIGYKMTRVDGTAFKDGKTHYAVGQVLKVDGPADGAPCGSGLHLSHEKHGPMKYNAVWPWRLWECSYDEADILGKDNDKVRVQALKIEQELDATDIGLPHADQFFQRLARLKDYSGMQPQTPARKKNIEKALREYVKRLNAHPAAKGRVVMLKRVKFYGIEEWGSVRAPVRASVWGSVRAPVWASVWSSVRAPVRASVWASVWASVRASVRASVWASVWASVRASVWASVRASVRDSVWASVWDSVALDDERSPFILEHDILDYGAVLYGIDKDGVAHVIMPTKEEHRKAGVLQ